MRRRQQGDGEFIPSIHFLSVHTARVNSVVFLRRENQFDVDEVSPLGGFQFAATPLAFLDLYLRDQKRFYAFISFERETPLLINLDRRLPVVNITGQLSARGGLAVRPQHNAFYRSFRRSR